VASFPVSATASPEITRKTTTLRRGRRRWAEHPDPDPRHLAAAQYFRAVAERILEIDTRLRGAKELAGLVAELPADVGIDLAIEQRIDQHLDELTRALAWRGEILAVLR
jgi:hypothetical protein